MTVPPVFTAIALAGALLAGCDSDDGTSSTSESPPTRTAVETTSTGQPTAVPTTDSTVSSVPGTSRVPESTAPGAEPSGSPEIPIATAPSGSAGRSQQNTFLLRYDRASDCIYFELNGRRVQPLWPHGIRALRDPVRVVDAEGKVVVRVDEVFVTGGNALEVVAEGSPACGAESVWAVNLGS
jgi:hypothetical protein